MRCPLTLKANFYVESGIEVVGMDCLKEECGQYDEANNCCAPIALNQNLVAIGNVLGTVAKGLTLLRPK